MIDQERASVGDGQNPSSGANANGRPAVPLKPTPAKAGSEIYDKGVMGELAVQHILERYLTRYPDGHYRL